MKFSPQQFLVVACFSAGCAFAGAWLALVIQHELPYMARDWLPTLTFCGAALLFFAAWILRRFFSIATRQP